MAYQKIPVRTDIPAYGFSLSLEGTIYYFSFEWNDRGGFWTFDILDQDQNHIVAGVRLVANISLLGRFNNSKLPAGELFLLDTSGKNQDPSFDNFGTVVLLFYRESTTVDV